LILFSGKALSRFQSDSERNEPGILGDFVWQDDARTRQNTPTMNKRLFFMN